MAAQPGDKFKKVGASTVTSLAAPGKAIGATSITVGSTTNYPLDTGVVVAIRVVDTAGALVSGTYTEWNAIVTSATSLTLDPTPAYGSDQVYAAGSSTQVYISVAANAHNQMVDGLLVAHDQDGTLKDDAVTAGVIADNAVTTSTVADSAITTSKLADGSVTAVKTSFGGSYSTSEVNTGFTWVNGDTIYKKTVSFGALPSSTTKAVAHGASVKKIINYEAISDDGASAIFPIPFIRSAGGTDNVELRLSTTNITIITNTANWVTQSAYVTIYYTKT